MSYPTAKIVLRTIRANKAGLFPVVLRIIYERKARYYSLNIFMSPEDFQKIEAGKRLSEEQREIRSTLLDLEERARDVFKDLPFFEWDLFKSKYFQTEKIQKGDDLLAELRQWAEQLTKEGRVGYAKTIIGTAKSLQAFANSTVIPYQLLTPAWFEEYERFMADQGKGVGPYLRAVRALLNSKKRAGKFPASRYPFGKGKYEIPSTRNVKRALPEETLQKLFLYHTELKGRQRWMDLWKFLYLAGGMNVADLVRLTHENIQERELIYYRQKTKRTRKKDKKPIRIPLSPMLKDIIAKHSLPKRDKNGLLFFERVAHTEEEFHTFKENVKRKIKKALKEVCNELGIKERITAISARHTFATRLIQSGLTLSVAQQYLGHAAITTTQIYVAELLNEHHDQTIEAITKNLGRLDKD